MPGGDFPHGISWGSKSPIFFFGRKHPASSSPVQTSEPVDVGDEGQVRSWDWKSGMSWSLGAQFPDVSMKLQEHFQGHVIIFPFFHKVNGPEMMVFGKL